MPIQLPDLALKTYKETVDEMIVSIPKYSDKWTNFNPADPGITIIELLSWISDMTLYRINRIPDESYVNFLRMVAGASGAEYVEKLLKDLNEDPAKLAVSDRAQIKLLKFLLEIENGNKKSASDIKSRALEFLDSHYRAVTESDFELLSIEATENEVDKVKRAIVEVSGETGRIEIIIVSDIKEDVEMDDKYTKMISIVKNYLHPRRLVGTRIEVKKPEFTHLKIKIEIICLPHARARTVEKKIQDAILTYLDPLTGGQKENGWTNNRSLTVFEIDRIIEETYDVDRTKSVEFHNSLGLPIAGTIIGIKGLIKINREDITVTLVEDE